MTKFLNYLLSSIMVTFSALSCAKQAEKPKENIIERKDIPLTKTQQAYVQANNQFAFNLLKQVYKEVLPRGPLLPDVVRGAGARFRTPVAGGRRELGLDRDPAHVRPGEPVRRRGRAGGRDRPPHHGGGPPQVRGRRGLLRCGLPGRGAGPHAVPSRIGRLRGGPHGGNAQPSRGRRRAGRPRYGNL